MQITEMLYGSELLEHVDFPATEVLGSAASEDEIQGLLLTWNAVPGYVASTAIANFINTKQH
jgi:hypothetical protein